MQTPTKPWERPTVGQPSLTTRFQQPGNFLPITDSGVASSTAQGQAPPVPPRPGSQGLPTFGSSGFNTYSSFSSPYYGPGIGGYNTYGGYNPYGGGYGGYTAGYGSPYYGRMPASDNEISRLAEERSREAFHSVESVVQAFSSVSMMLESALNAIYTSFRAVLGLADQFSSLKNHFHHLFTTLAVFRFVRWLYRRLLVFLHLRPPSLIEDVWTDVMPTTSTVVPDLSSAGGPGGATNWPLILFWALALGGPYLIYKLSRRMVEREKDMHRWAIGEAEHFVGQALYSFSTSSVNEVSFQAGDLLKIAPKELQPAVRGWLLASREGQKPGLVPGNYVRILGRAPGSRPGGIAASGVLPDIVAPQALATVQQASAASSTANVVQTNEQLEKCFEESF